MIDIHTHILNNVDDGSNSEEQSLEILKLAQEAGFTDVILTPHYIENYYENDYSTIKPKIDQLKSAVIENEIIVKLHQGNEVYMSDDMERLIKNKTVSSLAQSRYLLFELPLKSKIFTLDSMIIDIRSAGMIPVLAHPERYVFVQENPNEILDIISKGVLIQCNYGSIIGQYGKEANKTVIKLLKNNMVHFMGSDTHKNGYIYERFDKVEKELLKHIDEKKLEKITTTNPRHILQNTTFKIDEPREIKKRLFFR